MILRQARVLGKPFGTSNTFCIFLEAWAEPSCSVK